MPSHPRSQLLPPPFNQSDLPPQFYQSDQPPPFNQSDDLPPQFYQSDLPPPFYQSDLPPQFYRALLLLVMILLLQEQNHQLFLRLLSRHHHLALEKAHQISFFLLLMFLQSFPIFPLLPLQLKLQMRGLLLYLALIAIYRHATEP